MFSRLQASIPVLTDEDNIEGWIKKIFPWNYDKEGAQELLDHREYYRLNLEAFPALDATVVFRDGSVGDLLPLDISAGGLSGHITTSLPLFEGQRLRVVFVLPLDEPVVLNTEVHLIAKEHDEFPDAWVLHLQFSDALDDSQKELLHRFIIKKQFQLIKRKKGWRFS